MFFDIISDIHLDFWIKKESQIPKFVDKIFKNSSNDVLVIAGDIGHYNTQNIKLLEILSQIYTQIFIVFGNHDLYLISKKQQSKYKLSINRINELKQTLPKNVIFLDGVVEYNGIKIFGSGLWYDFSMFGENEENILRWIEVMNDSKYIFEQKIFKKYITNRGEIKYIKFNPMEFFKKEYQKISKADIFITHVPPLLPQKIDESSEFYFFEGKNKIDELNPKIWIFGHIHKNYDFFYENTRLISNPLGYQNNNFYLKTLTIE